MIDTVHTTYTAFIASTAYTVETAFEQKGYNAYILQKGLSCFMGLGAKCRMME